MHNHTMMIETTTNQGANMTTITYHDTAYYGIHVQDEDGIYTLISGYDDEETVGSTYPTEAQITHFRNRVIR